MAPIPAIHLVSSDWRSHIRIECHIRRPQVPGLPWNPRSRLHPSKHKQKAETEVSYTCRSFTERHDSHKICFYEKPQLYFKDRDYCLTGITFLSNIFKHYKVNIREKLENIKIYKENKHHLLACHLEITSVYTLAFHLRTGSRPAWGMSIMCLSLTLCFLREAIPTAPCLKRQPQESIVCLWPPDGVADPLSG